MLFTRPVAAGIGQIIAGYQEYRRWGQNAQQAGPHSFRSVFQFRLC